MSTPAPSEPAAAPAPPAPAAPPPKSRKPLVIGIIVLLLLILGIPRILHSLHTVSTDDAYVNSYVTFVAPRVAGQVARVLVDDNNRVTTGDILVELDSEPYRVHLAIKQAALEAAQADIVVAEAAVRGQIGQTRGYRFKLQHAIEDVDNQVALLRARAATLDQSKAALTLAETEFERARKLAATKVVSAEELDQKREVLDVARAQMQQSLESVYQARAALGLPARPAEGQGLTEVPADLDQTFSTVRQALAELMQGAAQLGVVTSSYNLTPKQVVDEFYQRDPGGDIDRIYAEIIKTAPSLKQAQAGLLRAQRDLEQAQLDLRYCTIRAEIDGVVTRRNVNPGNHVQVGQSLMAIRSLKDLWVDANFKETQLRDLRIGQRVELEVDMYGSKQKFEGRVSGFTMGTGSTLALLPAQNATGNFVKVVQRLPVRIDVVNLNPEKAPLFVGLSIEPRVDISSAPTGPNAGQFLQAAMAPAAPPAPTTPATPKP
jgi:membrane fusion protein (multidrug efflux system)